MVSFLQKLGSNLVSRPWVWWGWLLTWAVLLFILSSESNPPMPGPEFPSRDKVLHCAYFSGGAFCFLLGLWGRGSPLKTWRFAVAGMLFTGFAGALDEFHQTFTPGRSGNDFFDWLADLSGGLLGAMIALLFLRWVRRASFPGQSKAAAAAVVVEP